MTEPRLLINRNDGRTLAQAIVDTVRAPLLVLDGELRVVSASRSFYRMFQVTRDATDGRRLTELGNGQWDIPELRVLLGEIVPTNAVMEGYEVERDFPTLGRRTMLLDARKVFYEDRSHATLLLAIEDITERHAAEREMIDLVEQRRVLLEEMRHRIANSLQIIANILLLKAHAVTSEETRLHLQDAHQRVMSVAAVQQILHVSRVGEAIRVSPYLTTLCENLASSMIGDTHPIGLTVAADDGEVSPNEAVSIGLIVTELVINALKHAFAPAGPGGTVHVSYERDGTDWRLAVADDGVGKPDLAAAETTGGLGTSIVEALAQQMGGRVEVSSSATGTTVSIVHATFSARPSRPVRVAARAHPGPESGPRYGSVNH